MKLDLKKLNRFGIFSFAFLTALCINVASAAPISHSRPGAASSSTIPKGIYAGLGILDFDAGVASSSANSGTKPFFYQTYTVLSLVGYYNVKDQWSVSPIFNYTLIGRKSSEGKEKTSVTVLGARAFHPAFFPGFNLHFGPGLIVYRIDGSGGTTDLNNGSGTSTFGIPSETRASNSIYWDLGAGYQVNKYRFELSLLFTEIFKTSKRAISPVLSATTEIF